MKPFFTTFSIFAAIFGSTKACNVPHVSMEVQYGGRAALGTQEASEFFVPLYTDCNYQSLGQPVYTSANGPALATAVTASFADNGGFVDQDGLSLDSNSLNTFLGFFGKMFDADTLLQLVICTALGSDGNSYQFGPGEDFLFNSGAAVDIGSYQCVIDFVA